MTRNYQTNLLKHVSFIFVSEKPPTALADFKSDYFKDFRPPPRFAASSFASFVPGHKSQELAVAELLKFISKEENSFRWPWQKRQSPALGLYLDGGFGVGKTHLLAAAFHAFSGKKIYLSFSELVYFIGVLGRSESARVLADFQLFCIDEFELDDPGNTLIVKSFLEQLFSHGAKVITTSNTTPEAQGEGRFNADDFKREIQGIARHFELISMDGPDYRKRNKIAKLTNFEEFETLAAKKCSGSAMFLNWQELFELLRDNHPINYQKILSNLDCLFISRASTIALQVDALRFVHFIDKLYDLKISLRMSGDISLQDLFDDSYVSSAYEKKHYRCLSRISELLEE